MPDYDFKTLNDKEFEILCADVLGQAEGHRFERFKPGKDAGVDGRYFADNGGEVILQCKHWCNTPLKQLIQHLASAEKPKLDKLKPQKYLLAISNELSRLEKKAIVNALSPHIQSQSDIYGREDLNDLLEPEIEQRHYKLWLHSSSVLGHVFNNAIYGRSEFSIEEIIRSSTRYVVTSNHRTGIEILESLGVVIITGDPGVGKTTLADHLCLHYVANGFKYLKIADDLKEAEAVFDLKSKQIFYYDDFLGRNYLDAIKGDVSTVITQFIRRVSTNHNKRFVLTSRSTVLNHGKFLSDCFEHANLKKNEFEVSIKTFSNMDKAQILYNHLWHSNLDSTFIDELYIDKRYRKIISHKNFNPRLISYITDASRLDAYTAANYWEYITQSLDNPSQIWENPFVAQQDDFGRTIVFLVVLHGKPILENVLAEAYQRYVSLPEHQNLKGRREFQSNIRVLTGAFLNRQISSKGPSVIDLFNPSIGDFVLNRYAGEVLNFAIGIFCLRTKESIVTLRSLVRIERLSKEAGFSACNDVLRRLHDGNFEGVDIPFISSLCETFRLCWQGPPKALSHLIGAFNYILQHGKGVAIDDSFSAIAWALQEEHLNSTQALEFIDANIDVVISDFEIQEVTSLLQTVEDNPVKQEEIRNKLAKQVIEIASDNMKDFIEVNDLFDGLEYGDYESAYCGLEKAIEDKMEYLGVVCNSTDLKKIARNFDIAYEMDNFFTESFRDRESYSDSAPTALTVDEIDDLFQR